MNVESFLGGLVEFNKYLTTLSSPSDFSATELRRIMSSFQQPFEDHFHAEIKTIASMASHPKAPKPGSEEEATAGKTFKTWGKSTVTKAGMADVVPFFLLNLDGTAEEGMWANWPPMPGPIKVSRSPFPSRYGSLQRRSDADGWPVDYGERRWRISLRVVEVLEL